MKKQLRFLSAFLCLAMALFITSASMQTAWAQTANTGASAQTDALSGATLPLDPQIRYGKLDNGLTYYILQNKKPENQGYFYLVQNVGAVQEEAGQNGLAHFLEHLAFSGTAHFPDGILAGLEKYGAEFGRNINAYTSTDRTVYLLSGIPISEQGAIDTSLMVMHDWSNSISLNDKDIDDERPIITEEFRTRQNNPYIRLYQKEQELTMAGSRYEDLTVIGDTITIQTFPYKVLRDYYHKWYRPDLQALIVVGDFDAAQMEAKVKDMFSDIPKAVNPAERIYYPIPDNDKPIVAIATDPEATSISLSLQYKMDVYPRWERNSADWVKFSMQRSLISRMFGARFTEISEKPDAPIRGASAYHGSFGGTPTKDAWRVSAGAKEESVTEAMRLIMTENERARRYGFTDTELERAKASTLSFYGNRANNRNTENSGAFINPMIEHYLSGLSILDYNQELEIVRNVMAGTSAEDLRAMLDGWITDRNIVITISGMQKAGVVIPNETQLLDMLQEVKTAEIEPYVDKVLADKLIEDSELPLSGRIVKSEEGAFGSTVWTLSNGMKVVIKQTDNSDDEIVLNAYTFGGRSLYSGGADDYFQAGFAGSGTIGGIGKYSIQDVNKMLMGKSVGVYPMVREYETTLMGNSVKNDIESMFQLIYLNMTSPRKDVERFTTYVNNAKESLRNRANEPFTAFADTVMATRYGYDNIYRYNYKEADFDRVDYDRIIEIYKALYSNPGAWTFFFTGTVDMEAFKPLVEKYMASLPSGNKDATYKKFDIPMNLGEITNHFNRKMEVPTASTLIEYYGELTRDLENQFKYDALNNILFQVFTRSVREEEGGSYGVGSQYSVSRIPSGETTLIISYDSNPDRVNYLNSVIYRELQNLADNGPRDDEFNNAIEAVVKNYKEAEESNGRWNNILYSRYLYGEDIYTDYESRIRSITKADIAQLIKDILAAGNRVEVVMLPEAAAQ